MQGKVVSLFSCNVLLCGIFIKDYEIISWDHEFSTLLSLFVLECDARWRDVTYCFQLVWPRLGDIYWIMIQIHLLYLNLLYNIKRCPTFPVSPQIGNKYQNINPFIFICLRKCYRMKGCPATCSSMAPEKGVYIKIPILLYLFVSESDAGWRGVQLPVPVWPQRRGHISRYQSFYIYLSQKVMQDEGVSSYLFQYGPREGGIYQDTNPFIFICLRKWCRMKGCPATCSSMAPEKGAYIKIPILLYLFVSESDAGWRGVQLPVPVWPQRRTRVYIKIPILLYLFVSESATG